RTSWLTAAIARRLLRIDTANLVNLAVGWESGARPVPEFYQEACTPEALSATVAPLLVPGPARSAQQDAAAEALRVLGRGAEPPGRRAARAVLDGLGQG
ncbi:MAG: lipid-A-disaccharide synthase, partial [Pseudomonadota bacterium]